MGYRVSAALIRTLTANLRMQGSPLDLGAVGARLRRRISPSGARIQSRARSVEDDGSSTSSASRRINALIQHLSESWTLAMRPRTLPQQSAPTYSIDPIPVGSLMIEDNVARRCLPGPMRT